MTTKDNEGVFILGHRGVRGGLENTLPAFRRALAYADGVEFDVRMTFDGKLVLLHEGFFWVDGERYSVRELTLAELRRLHPLGRLITTVESVLKLKPRVLNADIKDVNALEPLLRVLERRGLLDSTVISTDVVPWFRYAVRECPDCRLGLSVTGPFSLAGSLLAKAYSVHVPLDLVRYVGSRGFVALLRFYRRRTHVWLWNYTMNEVEWVPRMLPLVDAVISDDPARLKRFISPRCPSRGAT